MDRKFLPAVLAYALIVLLSTPSYAGLFPFGPKKNSSFGSSAQDTDQINIYNEQAIRLFEEGKFKEAQELWEKAIAIMESSQGSDVTVDDPKALSGSEEDLEFSVGGLEASSDDAGGMYETAVVLFKREKYVAAKQMFERIEAFIPDFKATRNYLTILDHKLRQAQQALSGDKFKDDALARREERAQWDRILRESELELRRKLNEQADPVYQEAVNRYKIREFKSAKDYFREVNRIAPSYKDVDKYMMRIDADIQNEERRSMAEMREKEVLARKAEQEEWSRILKESERQLQKKIEEQAESVYVQAVGQYKRRQFEAAKTYFDETDRILPDYKLTRKYLQRIDRDIEEEVRFQQQQRVRELAQKKREEEIARKQEEERLKELQEVRDRDRLTQFQAETAARQKEREEWLKVLEENEKERLKKLEEQAAFVYQEALRIYKSGKFQEAKEEFLEVQRIAPNYKLTAKFLAQIDQDIENEDRQRQAQQERILQRMMREEKLAQRQKIEEQRQQRLKEEQDRLQALKEKALDREKQREEWDRVLYENQRGRQKKFEEEAEFIYGQALEAYRDSQWERSRDNFLEVQRILSGYKQTDYYLSRIDDDIQAEAQEKQRIAKEEAERLRREEMLRQNQERELQMKQREAHRQQEIRRQEARAQTVYNFALSLYRREDYSQAKDKFLELEQFFPGFKDVAKYLQRIDGDIARDQERRALEQQRAFEVQMKQQRLAQGREEKRLELLDDAKEKLRIQELKQEAIARQREREEWEKTVKLVESEHQKRLRRQAESMYDEAMRYYRAGWFMQAKETFQEIQTIAPGYKSVEKYMAQIEVDINQDEQLRRENEEKINVQALSKKQIPVRKKEPIRPIIKAAESKMEPVQESVPGPRTEKTQDLPQKKSDRDRVIKKAVQGRQKKIKREVDVKYREALSFYKAKNFTDAKLKFIEVESLLSGYKETTRYLTNIDQDIRRERTVSEGLESEASREAVQAKRGEGSSGAVSRSEIIRDALAVQERQMLNRGSGNAKSSNRLRATPVGSQNDREKYNRSSWPAEPFSESQRQEKRKALNDHRRTLRKEIDNELQQLYREAIDLYRSGLYGQAKDKFLEIERIIPDYKKTLSYLKKTEARLEQESSKLNVDAKERLPDQKKRRDVITDALNAFEERL